MKRTILAGVAALLALILSGCFISLENGAGSVGIQLPPPRSISGDSLGSVGRIYVINGSASLPLDDGGAEFVEFELPDDGTTLESYSVGPIPSGDGYQVILVFGDFEEDVNGDQVFVPGWYALSEELTVYAGQATLTEILTPDNPGLGIEPSLLGLELTSLAIGGANIYTMTNDTLYQLPADFSSDAIAYSMGVSNAVSLDLGSWSGQSQIWVNTQSGILPFWLTGGSAFTFMALNFGDTTVTVSPVVSSGAFTDGTNTYGYYQFEGGLGGVWDEDNDGLNGWLDEVDLSDIVVGEPVYDLAVDLEGGNIDGYFATKLGAFMLQEDDVRAGYTEAREVLRNATFFELTIDGVAVPITNIAISGNDLFLGTPRGVVVADKSEVSGLSMSTNDNTPDVGENNGDVVPGSAGLVTKQLAISTNYKAILTENVILVQAGAGEWKEFPVSATVSSEISGIFLDNSTGVVLAVGDGGLSYFDIDEL